MHVDVFSVVRVLSYTTFLLTASIQQLRRFQLGRLLAVFHASALLLITSRIFCGSHLRGLRVMFLIVVEIRRLQTWY